VTDKPSKVRITLTGEQIDRFCGRHASDYHDYKDWWDEEGVSVGNGQRSILADIRDVKTAVELFGWDVLS
jgi:hypothetical protein